MKVAWKIYYADGTTFSNLDGTWEEAPLDGVQCVAVADPDLGRVIYSDADYYPAAPEPYTADLPGLMAYLRAYVPQIKYGLCIAREDFLRIVNAASDDPDFEKKSPRRRHDD